MLKKIVVAALCICVFGTVLTASLHAAAEKKDATLDISSIASDTAFDLPKINEIFKQARNNGITEGWEKRIHPKKIEYSNMSSAPERAFVTGKVLADITFFVLDKDQKLSLTLLKKADAAISSIENLPEDIKSKLKAIKNGSLQGEPLRKKMDELITSVLRRLRGESDPAQKTPLEKIDKKLQDSGMLITAAGFFRAMYMGASSVAAMPSPEDKHLSMFRYGSVAEHFIRYFEKDADKSFQKDRDVKDLVKSLKVIVPIIQKKKLNKADVQKISKALEAKFK